MAGGGGEACDFEAGGLIGADADHVLGKGEGDAVGASLRSGPGGLVDESSAKRVLRN